MSAPKYPDTSSHTNKNKQTRSDPITEKVTKWVGAWNARRLSFITDREIRDEYLVPSFDIVARIRARRLTWAGHLLREKEEHVPTRVAVARLKSDLQDTAH